MRHASLPPVPTDVPPPADAGADADADAGAPADLADALRATFAGEEHAVPRAGWRRLLRTSRAAAGAARAVLGGRLRGRGDGLAAADLDAVARLAGRLGELKGVAMKAGQLLGYVDPSLSPQARALLSVLHTRSPASPLDAVIATVRSSLGDRADALLAGLDPAPVAVASIGQVHRARLPDGRDVAVKIRHPGIVEALEADFRAAGSGAAFAALLAPGARGTVRDAIAEARDAILGECDFAREADHQRAFARFHVDDPRIVVPAVLDAWCGDAVLATAWEPGATLDAFVAAGPSQAARDRAGAALASLYIGTLYRHGLFHADPHPGNLALRADGQVVVYDYGCVRRFDGATVVALADLVRAVRADDADAIAAAIAALGATPPRRADDAAHLRALLRGFFAPLLAAGPRAVEPGAGLEAQTMMRDKRALMRLALPGKLLFLFRLRFGLYAVLARLGAVADWAALEAAWADEARARHAPVA